MYELEEFERNSRENRNDRDSIRKALEEGRLRPVPMRLPRAAEHRRSRRRGEDDRNRCGASAKIVLGLVLLSLVAMLFYAVWRIRAIEESSEASDWDYRMIGESEINDNEEDGSDNRVDGT